MIIQVAMKEPTTVNAPIVCRQDLGLIRSIGGEAMSCNSEGIGSVDYIIAKHHMINVNEEQQCSSVCVPGRTLFSLMLVNGLQLEGSQCRIRGTEWG